MFLKNVPNLLRSSHFNDWLVLVKDKFGYYGYCFAHCFDMFLFTIEYFIDETIWCELCYYEFFFDDNFLDNFNYWFFFQVIVYSHPC